MAVGPKDVRTLAPELEDESTTRLKLFISIAENCVNADVFGCKADHGVTLLAAHLTTLANREGSGGAITTEKVGDLQTSYNSGNLDKSKLCTTAYGQMFWDLMTTVRPVPFVVGC